MAIETAMPDGGDWKREVHEYIDQNFEKLNTAIANGSQTIRDGQLSLSSDIESLDTKIQGVETNLTCKIESVLAASEKAHGVIIGHLEKINSRLEKLENGGG